MFGNCQRTVSSLGVSQFPNVFPRTERRQKPGAKAKKHKQQLAEMAAAQLKVETLGYLDSGEEPTDPDQAGYEEAMDLLGTTLSQLVFLHLILVVKRELNHCTSQEPNGQKIKK